jgi:2-iminobutanoate/2-iminopropanoate deaminase
MERRRTVTQSDAEATIAEVHPRPDRAAEMPYPPAIEVTHASQIVFLSGATASPLYHEHPHVKEEHVLPDDIEEQTRRAMESIRSVLEAKGMTWGSVVKVTKYLTDIREMDAVNRTMSEYLGDHRPASTLICVNNLSSPAARVELDMIAVGPGTGA